MNVLDSSAVMAVIRHEPGGDLVTEVMRASVVSAVNYSEVITVLINRGGSPEQAASDAARLQLTVVPFDEALAEVAARLRAATRHVGLSFGDRACLAQALALDRPVLTADRRWAELDIGVEIQLIR